MIGTWLHKHMARAAFTHFSRHDLDNFSKPWDEDVVFIYPPGTSFAGRFEGKTAMKAWIQRYMDCFPRIKFTVQNVGVRKAFGLASNVVAAEWDVFITNRKGKDFEYSGVTVFHIKKTKVVLAKDYIFDTSVLKRALEEDGGVDGR